MRHVVPLLVALLLPAPALAGWSTETVAGQGALVKDLAFDSGGALLTAWNQGPHDAAWAFAPAGGAFATAGTVDNVVYAAHIATDGHGEAYLAYASSEHGIFLDRRGGATTKVAGYNRMARPVVAANRRGHVAVAWREYDGQWFIRVAVRPAGGEFGPIAKLGSGTAAQDPVVAVTRGGEVVVAWVHNAAHRIEAAVAPVGEAFSEPAAISSGTSVSRLYPAITADADGRVTVAWLEFAEGTRIVAVSRAAGQAWGEPATIVSGGSGDADAVGPPQIAALDGRWLLAFRRGQSVQETIVTLGDPGPVRTLDSQEFDQQYRTPPAVAGDPDTGRAVLAWVSGTGRVGVVRRSADGVWTDADALGADAADVRAALDGQAAVAWTEGSAGDAVLRAARFVPENGGGGGGGGGTPGDTTAPTLRATLASPQRLRALLPVRVGASEDCTLRLTARLTTPQRRLGTTVTTRRLAAGRAVVLHVRLPRALQRSARTALRAHRRVTLRLTLRATDAAGNARLAGRTARLVLR